MNESGIKPVGYRVLVKIDSQKKKTEGGIILPEELLNKEDSAITLGTVVDVGNTCWLDDGDGTPWTKVGDKVYYRRYSGSQLTVNEQKYRLINDRDIAAVVEKEIDKVEATT